MTDAVFRAMWTVRSGKKNLDPSKEPAITAREVFTVLQDQVPGMMGSDSDVSAYLTYLSQDHERFVIHNQGLFTIRT